MLTLLFPLLYFAESALAIDSLKVAFEWKKVDFEYPSEDDKIQAIRELNFIPEYNIPLGLEIYEDRIFITLPRWKMGIAASLAYISKSDLSDSPKLRPYPNWAAHDQDQETPEIVSAFRMRADSCGRLWVIDAGVKNILDSKTQVVPPTLLIYDLKKDELLRVYRIPNEQRKKSSFFTNIAVEDNDCNNSFAYLADLGHPALVVYDFAQNRSWMVKHNYFHLDPAAANMNVSGIPFQWEDGLFGLALSDKDSEGYSTLYFHPMISFNEFTVSTKILRNETLVKDQTAVFHDFKLLGSRGPKAQSGVSFLHKKTGVLFYTLLNLNAVACWRTPLENYTMESQGRIFVSNETMVFPNDIKVDANDTIWVLSDKLPIFMYSSLNYNEYNFRILKSSVKEAINNTACDTSMVMDMELMRNITRIKNKQAPGAGVRPNVAFSTILFILAVIAFR